MCWDEKTMGKNDCGGARAILPRAKTAPGRFVIALALKDDDEARLSEIRRARPVRCGRVRVGVDLDGQGAAGLCVNEAVLSFGVSEMDDSPGIRLAYARASAEGAWDSLADRLEAWVILWNEADARDNDGMRPAARYSRCFILPAGGEKAELHLIRPGKSGWFSGTDVQAVRDCFEEDS